MRVRVWAVAVTATMALGGLAACGGSPDTPGATPTTGAPTVGVGEAPSTEPTTPAPKPTTKKTSAPLTCAMIRNGTLGSSSVKFNGYSEGIPLADGIWAGEDGAEVELTACAVGDLDGDGSLDALAAVKLSAGGTGRFWSLHYWRNVNGSPKYTAQKELDDRTPVETIAISGGKAEVVWLTRGPSDPAVALTIRRTSLFTVSGATLTEVTHSDEPYAG